MRWKLVSHKILQCSLQLIYFIGVFMFNFNRIYRILVQTVRTEVF